ncbi:unnamed protein product [Symbiodinium microadriaticum]|nr:unnamed protein product [Symbiodinium microadriaticum]CAE7832292.1 unnamed protein product [Symbiodinium sp. KB8]
MEEEPRQPTAVETSSTSIPTVPMELEATEPAMDTTDLIDHKRKGPESRTVVIGSESKNQRTEALVLATLSNCDLNVEDYVRQYSWMASRGRKHKTGFPNQLVTACNMPIFSLLDAYMNKCLYTTLPVEPPVVGKTLVSLPGSVYSSFLVNLQDGCSFKVDTDTDNITEDEIYPIWDQVEEADKKEADCASTTATRLSQRIVLSTAATNEMDCESFDVSGAFLKGFMFEKIRQILRSKGVVSPVRNVVVIPPANVWRHLAQADPSFDVGSDFASFGLACDKPAYGLNDAPLAWQLCLHVFLKKHGGFPSLMDENLFIWKSPHPENKLKALVSAHVDDLATAAMKSFLTWLYNLLVKEFGSVTRQVMPFDHRGCRYERTEDGYKMTQTHFAEKLSEVVIPDAKKDHESLLDLISEVALLQSQVTKAKIEHLRMANRVVQKAKHGDYINLGLHYCFLKGPLRLMCTRDASSANKDRNYAQEGILVVLCEDGLNIDVNDYKLEASDALAMALGGKANVLWSRGAKAKRVSYSTSHAETLAAIGGLETVSLVTIRLSELYYPVFDYVKVRGVVRIFRTESEITTARVQLVARFLSPRTQGAGIVAHSVDS